MAIHQHLATLIAILHIAQNAGDKWRIDIARMDGVDPDAQGRPFQSGRLGQHQDPALGSAIGGRPGTGDLAHDGRDVDHRAAPLAGGYGRAAIAQAQENPVQIDRQSLAPALEAMGHQVQAGQGDAGIVHQDVEAAEGLHSTGDNGLPVVFRRHVMAQEHGLAAVCEDFIGQVLSSVLSQVGKDDARAFPRQSPRRLRAEARSAPRHQGCPACYPSARHRRFPHGFSP